MLRTSLGLARLLELSAVGTVVKPCAGALLVDLDEWFVQRFLRPGFLPAVGCRGVALSQVVCLHQLTEPRTRWPRRAGVGPSPENDAVTIQSLSEGLFDRHLVVSGDCRREDACFNEHPNYRFELTNGAGECGRVRPGVRVDGAESHRYQGLHRGLEVEALDDTIVQDVQSG